VTTGMCTKFQYGEAIIVADRGFIHSKVRRRGDTREY
jgi:hypothetical protein